MGEAPEPPWLDAEQQHAWRGLLVGMTLLMDRLDRELGTANDLSMNEYEVLVRLSEAEGEQLRMSHLAKATCHSRSRLTHIVSRMEDRGLVRRRDSQQDRRGVLAELMPPGRTLLEQAAPVHVRGVRQHLVDDVAPEDFAALGRVMNQVADTLSQDKPEVDVR